ncbi:divinyl chlorophyllide a 8-vinyl-reductase, chloroplastic [Magnolia sinica]|uniref:divinyl chlorophyllide a 8-vinyl-reductase, chloroplastic n=1 Tax=Magnolia sinica TaxID=86752 RepID=UPI002658B568|nr:divinyl chlorophyllide a 8-vinyl-reductase, chloroplastic [Magnolia sinica]XP_058083921.1 divinyl chlorophyllide a 8-vinyl-reductase, chloroplastic [Magnolia sinica]
MSLYPHHCLPQPITRYSIINPHLPSLPQPTIRCSIPSPHRVSSLPQSTIRYSITNSHPISSLPQPTIRYSRPNPHPISSLPQLTIRYSISNPYSIYSPPQPNIRYGLNPIKVSTAPNSAPSFRAKDPKDITILVVGSTGYIGRFVVKELVRRGFNVISVARGRSGIRGRSSKEDTLQELQGSIVCFSDVTDTAALEESLAEFCGARTIDVVVSCLASRSGGVKDSWKIDYEATRNSLVVGRKYGVAHFVLLSAICVQKPLLEFQRAKLKFEAELMEEAKGGDFTYSIVRPTAFFKSLGGQVELVKDGKPYVMFGDGRLCTCKPISEEDLASFIADCVLGEDKICKILPIGGPGKALTPLEQGEMLFRLLGKEPKFLKVPIGVMDFAIGLLDFLVKIFPVMEDAAEFGKIGRYYAAESMLVVDPETGEYSAEKTPTYGKDTLEDFFEKVIREGMAGQELGEQSIF